MRHFIYTMQERPADRRTPGTRRTVRIWRIVRNKPVFVVEHAETFVDEFQLIMIALKRAKALPAKAFERNANSMHRYGSASALLQAGIADVERLS